MFEGGGFPRVPAGGGVGAPGASAGEPTPDAGVLVGDAAGLLASLGAGGALAGVVEGLLARLLVTVRDADDEGSAADTRDTVGGGAADGEGSGACGGGSADKEGLFAGEPGGDVALVAAAEGRRMVGVEEAGASGLMALGASGLGELAAACRRLVAWATWGEALAAACLTGCAELSAHPGQWGPHGQVSPVVGYEERRFNATCLLSARLGVSRTRAGQMVDHGQALMSVGFAPVEAMERCGVLDSSKAFLVTRRLEDVPTLVALAVQDKVLPQAPGRSVSQVGRDLERALMELDPDGHAERAQANAERRCVSRPRPAGEGLCQVRLLLPTMDALLLDATLDAIAASAQACGDKRSLGQLRADAITAMTLSTLRTSQMAAFSRPAPGACGDRAEGRTGGDGSQAQASLPVISTGSCACQDGSGTDVTAGAGPGRLLPDGVALEGLLGALSGLVGSTSPWWTPSATGHLPLPAGIRINVNVTVPLTSLVGLSPPGDGLTGNDDPGGGGRADGPFSLASSRTSPGGSPATVRELFDRDSPEASGRSLPESRQDVPAAQSVAAAETLTQAERAANGAAQAPSTPTEPVGALVPAEAAETGAPGRIIGPAAPAQATESAQVADVSVGSRRVAVPAITAWALAAGGTWRRLVTDPASGVVLDIGRTRYRPPAGLADLVRARDKTCVFPTCQTPACRCDIDHLTPWSECGTTSLDNLAVLCQAHHRLKHTPGWALTRNQASGVLSWHTPDKTVYQRHMDGTINRLPRKVGPHQHLVPGGLVPQILSQQITPELIDRLTAALDNAHDSSLNARPLDPAAATTNDGGGSTRLLMTRGPQPGQRPGDYETTPYPQAAHTLGLAPLIDQAPPF